MWWDILDDPWAAGQLEVWCLHGAGHVGHAGHGGHGGQHLGGRQQEGREEDHPGEQDLLLHKGIIKERIVGCASYGGVLCC